MQSKFIGRNQTIGPSFTR